MELNAAVWSNMPSEMVDRIMEFMPVPQLCRNRILCKKLNDLICEPPFGAICAQRSRKDKDEDAELLVIRYVASDPGMRTGTHGWCALDIAANRWYDYRDDNQSIRHNFRSHIATMGGGLFCHFEERRITFNTIMEEKWRQVIVYNPLAAEPVKRLPLVPSHLTAHPESYPELFLHVDKASGHYKVFLINQYFDTYELYSQLTTRARRLQILNDPIMRIYNSATNQWKSATNPDCIRRGISRVAPAVMYQGLLYVFLVQNTVLELSPGESEPVWRYDVEHDTWENVVVTGQQPPPRAIARVIDVPSVDGQLNVMSSFRLITPPQLIAVANRLFIGGWSNKINPVDHPEGRRTRLWIRGVPHERRVAWSFAVSEINLRDSLRVTTFDISMSDVMAALGIPPVDRAGPPDLQIVKQALDLPPYICMFPLKNSILIMSALTGRSVAFDLATNNWDYSVPPSPVVAHNSDHSSLSGRMMNLILPTTPWYLPNILQNYHAGSSGS